MLLCVTAPEVDGHILYKIVCKRHGGAILSMELHGDSWTYKLKTWIRTLVSHLC